MAATGATGVQAQAGVPDVVAPPPRHPRFPLSDGARGFAAMAILIGHVWVFTEVYGVGAFADTVGNRFIIRMDGLIALFFGLSAFLLYRPMIAHRVNGPPSPRVSEYGLRRFLRLYPAYWVALTALAIFPGLFGVFSENWWAFYSMTDFLDPNLRDVCPRLVNGADQFFRCGLPQSWSLGVEMTFYAVLPLYAALMAVIARGREVRRWMPIELGLLAALAVASLVLAEPPFSLREEAWFAFSFLGHVYWLGLGLAIAIVSVVYKGTDPPAPLRAAASRPGACWLGALAVYLVTVFAFDPVPFPIAPFAGIEYAALSLLQGVAAVLVLIPIVFGNPNRGVPARLFGSRVLMWLGVISYGIVLWHVTIIVNLGYAGADAPFLPVLVGTTLLTIPLAAASYYLIERPLMKFKYRPIRDVLPRGLRRTRTPAEGTGGPG